MEESSPHGSRQILRCVVGSRAHGTATDTSDTDLVSVFVPGKARLYGVADDVKRVQVGKDHVGYALRHFVGLAIKGSPNALEALFAEPQNVLTSTREGTELLAHRELFVSRRCATAYAEHARAQIRKSQRSEEGSTRRELVYKHGYDTKMAAHTMRLLGTALDIITVGTVIVRRSDADWLFRIRAGEVYTTFEQYSAAAHKLIQKLDSLVETSSLHTWPDVREIGALTIRLHEMAWRAMETAP
jgi:hypothetical protein